MPLYLGLPGKTVKEKALFMTLVKEIKADLIQDDDMMIDPGTIAVGSCSGRDLDKQGSVYGKLPGRNHKDKDSFGNKLYSIIAEDRLL